MDPSPKPRRHTQSLNQRGEPLEQRGDRTNQGLSWLQTFQGSHTQRTQILDLGLRPGAHVVTRRLGAACSSSQAPSGQVRRLPGE